MSQHRDVICQEIRVSLQLERRQRQLLAIRGSTSKQASGMRECPCPRAPRVFPRGGSCSECTLAERIRTTILAESESSPPRCRPAIPAALRSTRRDLILEPLHLSRADSVRSRDPLGIKRAALTCAFAASKPTKKPIARYVIVIANAATVTKRSDLAGDRA